MKKFFMFSLVLVIMILPFNENVSANTSNWTDSKNKVENYIKNNAESYVNDFFNKLMEKYIGEKQVEQTIVSGQDTINELKQLEFVSGSSDIVILNNNKPTISYYDFEQSYVNYSDLDSLNRAGQATAHLTKENLISSENRSSQVFMPTGFHKNGKQDRGHVIAYTLTGNLNEDGQYEHGHDGSLDNPKNLFTQTSASNRGSMQIFENQVRDGLKMGSKVIYQGTPIFVDNELMARGIWLQAVSNDGTVEFNVYIHNVANGYKFDYLTGRKTKNKNFIVE